MAKLFTGFSRQDMTPNKEVPLGGYGNAETRLGDRVLHAITVSCAAFRDEDGTLALLFSQDTCATSGEHTERFKKLLAEKLGVRPENVFFHAIHTHEAPEVRLPIDHPLIREWYETKYYPAVLRAAEEAIADLAESEIYAGKQDIFGFNYVRRYLDKDGSFLMRSEVKSHPDATHETEPDRELQVIRFARQGKPDIILVNFQAHPSGFFDGSAKTDISSDYPHYIRTAVELSETAHCMFIQGAAGNLVFMGRALGDRLYANRDKTLACQQYGEGIAKGVLEVLKFKTQKLEAGKIKTSEKIVPFPINHATDGRLEDAKAVCALFDEGKKDEGKALAKEKGLYGDGGAGLYRCRAIVRRAQMPETMDIPVWAMTVGELGFGFAPNEVFDTNGVWVKENSPCKMTFICEQTNDAQGYLPTKLAFSHGGYEVDSCRFSPGVAELMAENLLEAIRETKKQ